jgi:hypothetical protein
VTGPTEEEVMADDDGKSKEPARPDPGKPDRKGQPAGEPRPQLPDPGKPDVRGGRERDVRLR